MYRSTISANPLVYEFVQKNGHTYNRYKEGSKWPRPHIFEGLESSLLTLFTEYVLPNDKVNLQF
jgi:hypothetical protein